MADNRPNANSNSAGSMLNTLLGTPSFLLVLLLAGLLGWHSLTDLDIWFHLRAGRDLLAGGGIPQLNTYSFTNPQHPWLNHEWFFQLITAWTAPASPLASGLVPGWHALRLTLVMLLTALLLLGDGAWRQWRQQAVLMAWPIRALVVTAGLLLIWPRFNLRPELLSYLFFVLLVRATDSHYNRPAPANIWRDASLWRLTGMIVIWAQVHGFAAMGPAILLMRVLLTPVESWRAARSGRPTWPQLALWTPVLLGIVALTLTPNHWHGLLFPLKALSQMSGGSADLSQTVSELVPLLSTVNSLHLTLWVFKISLVWGLVYSILGWRQISSLRILLFAAAAFAALNSQRSIGLYGLAFVLLHTGNPTRWLHPWWRRTLGLNRIPAISPIPVSIAASLIVTATVVIWAAGIVSNGFYLSEGVGRRFGQGSTPAIYPRAAATQLNNSLKQRTFSNLDAAAFLLGTTQTPLYIDGRTEAYPALRWSEYQKMRSAGPQSLAILKQQKVSTVVLALGSGAFTALATKLMQEPTWHVLAADAGGVSFGLRLPGTADNSSDVLMTAAQDILSNDEKDPTRRADLYQAAANLQRMAGRNDQSLQTLVLGLASRPDHPTLNHNLGNFYLASGDFAQALPHFEAALAVNKNLAGTALNVGVCLLRLKQPAAAIRNFRHSLRLDPRQVGGWVNLAVALRTSGQNKQAVEALEKALALRPGDARLQGQLQQWRLNR